MRTLFKLSVLLGGLIALWRLGEAALRYRPLHAFPPASSMVARSEVGEAQSLWRQIQVRASGPWLRFISERADTPPLSQTTNILLAGIDGRGGFRWGRTDALIVLVLDDREGSGHVGLVSIPRDLLVRVEGKPEPARINTVFALGRKAGGPGAGAALLKRTIAQNVGLPINQTIFIDQGGFERLVDQLGGVSVPVLCPIHDRFRDARGPGGRLELELDAGLHHLDGRTALMFARARYGRGVFDRARRQQALLLALRERLLALGLARARDALPALRRAVFSELTAVEMLGLGRRLSRVKRAQVHGLVIGRAEAEAVVLDDGRWVLIAKPAALRASLSRLFAAKTPGFREARRRCPAKDAGLRYRRAGRR